MYIGSIVGTPLSMYPKIRFIRFVYCITHFVVKNIKRKYETVLERTEKAVLGRLEMKFVTCTSAAVDMETGPDDLYMYWHYPTYVDGNSPVAVKSDIIHI